MEDSNVTNEQKTCFFEPSLVNEVELVYQRPKLDNLVHIDSSKAAYSIFNALYPKGRIDLKEYFFVAFLNRANGVLASAKLSEGGLSGTIVDVREIFAIALKLHASSVILCHNHPSGNLKPSKQDIGLTKKIAEAGKIMDINVLDHLIISSEGYISFLDEGFI